MQECTSKDRTPLHWQKHHYSSQWTGWHALSVMQLYLYRNLSVTRWSKTLPVMSKLTAKRTNKIRAVFLSFLQPTGIKRKSWHLKHFYNEKRKAMKHYSSRRVPWVEKTKAYKVLTHPATICANRCCLWILPQKTPAFTQNIHSDCVSHPLLPQHIRTYSLRVRRIIKVNGDSPDLRAQKIGWNHLDFIIPFTLPPDHKVVLRACFMYSAAFPPSTSMWSRLNKPSSGAQLQQ